MVRELREIIEDIVSIDTTADIEDIKAVAGFSPDVDAKIRELRDFLKSLHVKGDVPVTITEPLIIAEQKKHEHETETADVSAENVSFPELLELGLTEDRIAELYKLYQSRKNSRKMSFMTCIKCCKFVEDKINGTKVRLLKVKVVPIIKEYLKMIDPETDYNLCNVHDFLKGSALGCISKQFFVCKDGYLLKASS